MNIVSTIMQFITPVIAGRIASALGLPAGIANTAIAAALPAILAGLVGKATAPGGGAALSNVLKDQDPGILGSFSNILGGAQQSGLINGGTSALTNLLGGSATNALTGALAKFSGINTQQSGGLLGMLAPVVLGQLAQTQKSSGLDTGGLVKLLEGQKSNIASAIPSGFSSLLGGTGLLDSVAANLTPTTPKIDIPKPAAPSFNWLPWALGALVLIGGYMFLTSNRPAPQQTTAPAATPAAAPPVVNAAATLDEAKNLFGGLTAALGTIKDAPSAQAALPQLTATSTALDGLTKIAGSLAPDAKTQLRLLVSATMPQLTPLVDTVLAIPGAEAILKPVMDAILQKMTGLSKI